MQGTPQQADFNADGSIAVDELVRHVAEFARQRSIRFVAPPWLGAGATAPLLNPVTAADASTQPPSAAGHPRQENPNAAEDSRRRKFHVSPNRLPPGLPDWFLQRDANGDGQLSSAEYASEGTGSQRAQFARLDANGDDLLTPKELLRATKAP